MYSVIKHTYELVNTESVTRTTGEWKHYVYIFDTIEQATRYAISVIIDLPMIEANDYFLSHAIESFEEEDNNLSKKVIKMKIHPHGLESWDANGMPVDEDQTNTSGLKGLVGISKLDLDHTNNE